MFVTVADENDWTICGIVGCIGPQRREDLVGWRLTWPYINRRC